mmetsp:Transcript_48821/g.157593  ORF Transcript_48821/g.157593 Transcript_48821/m.157593 type:complete len:351 (-) Transcript_48821:540-1592(-)
MLVRVAAACCQSGAPERHRSKPPPRTPSPCRRRSYLPRSTQNACEFVFSLGLKGSLLIYLSNLCSTVLRSSCSSLDRTSVHKSFSSDFKSTWNFLLMEPSCRPSCRPARHHADRPVGRGARPAERPLGSSALASQRPSGPPGQLCPRQLPCPPGRSRPAGCPRCAGRPSSWCSSQLSGRPFCTRLGLARPPAIPQRKSWDQASTNYARAAGSAPESQLAAARRATPRTSSDVGALFELCLLDVFFGVWTPSPPPIGLMSIPRRSGISTALIMLISSLWSQSSCRPSPRPSRRTSSAHARSSRVLLVPCRQRTATSSPSHTRGLRVVRYVGVKHDLEMLRKLIKLPSSLLR